MNRIPRCRRACLCRWDPRPYSSTAQGWSCQRQGRFNFRRETGPGPWHRQETRLAQSQGPAALKCACASTTVSASLR